MNLQQFADITSTKDLVNTGEFVGMIRRKIRSKNTVVSTPPPQKLAGSARRGCTIPLFAAPIHHHHHLRRCHLF